MTEGFGARLGLQPQGRHGHARRPDDVRGRRDRSRSATSRRTLVAALGSVWVVNSKSNTVTRIDPETNRVAGAPIPVGQNPIGIAASKDALWVTNFARRHRQRASTPPPETTWTRPSSSSTPRSGAGPPRPSPRRTPASSRTRPWRSGTPSSAATETLRFHPGDVVLRAGERDRAFYLLLDGRLEAEGTGDRGRSRRPRSASPAFLDGQPRAVTLLARTARRAGAHELGRLRGARGARPAARPHDPRATSAAASPPGCAPPARRSPGWTG